MADRIVIPVPLYQSSGVPFFKMSKHTIKTRSYISIIYPLYGKLRRHGLLLHAKYSLHALAFFLQNRLNVNDINASKIYNS